MTLREMILAHRKAKRLSQADVGRLVGVDAQTISNIETGRTKTLKPSNLRRLAEMMGKPIEEIGDAVDGSPNGQPPAPEIQRIALELPTPLFISLRAIVKDDAAIHAFIVRAVADALADAVDPSNDATDVTTHRAKSGVIVARVKRQKRVRGSRG